MAEANRLRQIMEAEAEAEAIKIRGDAEAFAIDAKAKAEAEQMSKKAAAMNEYKSAAMIDMMLETLPKVSLILFIIFRIGFLNVGSMIIIFLPMLLKTRTLVPYSPFLTFL